MKRFSGQYPAEWPSIARAVKEAAGWHCIRCGHAHDRSTGHVLTVHHLDNNKGNLAWWNLAALCQKCHLRIQAKVILDRPWPYEHSDWFKPYAAGWYAYRYLGLELSRSEVEQNLEYYVSIEAERLKTP